ncbi:MAG: hypothetical protein KKG47_07945 [Proteobacteria bacterium]|nr:hypothetical protein [Pseudomonadota bacterium]MBU1738230.1 hypothetical protein [Pseudomonadota bacterium]
MPPVPDGGRVSVFLNLERHEVPRVTATVAAVEILEGENWVPISEPAITLDSETIGKGQVFLGSRVITASRYERMRLVISDAGKVDGEGRHGLPLDRGEIEIKLPDPLELAPHASEVILLNWDVDAAFQAESTQPLVFRAGSFLVAGVASNKVYVSCPDIDTVYVVRADKNWVQGAIAVQGRPTYVVADATNKKLFVLASAEATIKVYDLVSLELSEEIRIPMTRDPIYMIMAPDYLSSFILDGMGNLVKVDVKSGQMLARMKVGRKPVFALYLGSQERLAVSSTLDRTLYFLDPETLDVMEKIVVSGTPNSLLEWENYLYIAETETSSVSLYDLNERKMVKSFPLGYSPSRFVSSGNNIYLTDEMDMSVTVMKGGQINANKVISVSGVTGEMVVAEYQRLLYVGTGECDGSLAIVDLTSNRLIGKVEVGAKPLGVVVIQ